MRRRPPPFPVVLSVLVAGAGIAVLLANGNSSSPGRQPTVGIGPSHDCVRAQAAAELTARSAIVITASAEAPVSATEHASGPNGIVTETRSQVLTARLKVSEPISVKRVAVAHAGACANADSSTAAHDAALHKAYAGALAVAKLNATRTAEKELKALMTRLYPSVLSQARAKAAARAHQLALAAEPGLAAQALAAARRRAGG